MATETTPSSSLTRYRPVVLAIAGFAALYGAFVVYNNLQGSAPPATIHRSNAVHRSRRPARPSRPREPQPSETTTDQVSDNQGFQAAESYGRSSIVNGSGQTVHIELRPSALPTLQSLQEEHGLSEEQARESLDVIHRELIVRSMVMQFPNPRSPDWQRNIEAVTRWLGQLGISHRQIQDGLTQTLRDVQRGAAEERATVVNNIANNAATSVLEASNTGDADTVAGTEVGVRFGSGPAGLSLKQLLYHIAENQARQDGYLHRGFRCDSCGTSPIRGIRWKCSNCIDLDLCNDCHTTCMHTRNHIFYEIKIPTYAMNNLHPVQDLSYPGRFELTKIPNLSAETCKTLADKFDFEKAEIEGMYDQFTCLASTPRPGDALLYGVDKPSFQRAISPLSSSSPLRPNLIFDRMFALFDNDRDGLISFDDFVTGVAFLRAKSGGKSRRKKIFDAYDLDGDGYVTRLDFLRIFKALFTLQKDVALDLLSHNEAVSSLRDATNFAGSGRVISAAFTQSPRSVPDPRAPLEKPINPFGDRRHQPSQAIAKENSSMQGTRRDIVGNAWESQAQFPFDLKTAEALSLRDFLYLAPRDARNQPPTNIARDQKVRFTYGGSALEEARSDAWNDRLQRKHLYGIDDQVENEAATKTINGYKIPSLSQDVGRDIAYQVLEESLNELVDPIFKAKEDLHMEALAAEPELARWKVEIETYKQKKLQEQEAAEKTARDPLIAMAAAAEIAARDIQNEATSTDANTNGHPPQPSARSRGDTATMADAVVSLEEQVQAQPLVELLDSQGFGVREDQTQNDEGIATHLDISTQPAEAPTPSMRFDSGILTAASTVPAPPSQEPHYDPTMPQFMPNSERDILDSRPRDIIVDPLIPPSTQPNEAKESGHRPKFEAEIMRQFEHMFLGWDRDPTTGKLVNNATKASAEQDARRRRTGNLEAPTEERLARLVELQYYMTRAREKPGIDFTEFDTFLRVTKGSDFKFIEGWLEVCYF